MTRSFDQKWVLVYAIVVSCYPLTICAQEPRSDQMPAPPPMKTVSRSERAQLTAARDPKMRVKLTIELAEEHLTEAEKSTEQKRFDQAAEEVGAYLGLIDDARDFIGTMNAEKNSTRDLYRHLDIKLRAHLPRLAVMRRTTPAEYAVNLKAAEEHARDTRSAALDSFYGHTVLRDAANQKKPDKSNEPEQNKRP